MVEGGTCQDTERIRPTQAHSPTGDGRQRDLSGHRENPTDQGPLTSWRRQTEGLLRTPKESNRPRPTHQLKTADGGTCQDTERIRPTQAHSPTGTADRGTCQKNERIRPTKTHSHPGDSSRRDLSGHRKNQTDRGPLTSWRRQTVELVRTWKESDRLRRTHSLKTADRGDLSGHGKNPTGRGPLTNWRRQTEGFVKNVWKLSVLGPLTPWRRQSECLIRTCKESDRARPTHFLEPADGWTCEDTEGKKPTERWAWTLTNWNTQGEGQVSI